MDVVIESLGAEAADRYRAALSRLLDDARRGDPSEALYASLGWRLTGVVPAYARSAAGGLDPSAFYDKLLEGGTT